MTNRLPRLSFRKSIAIVCEGYEEYEYFGKLLRLNVWSKNYLIKLENAKGNGKIPARYNNLYSSDSYDLVLVFCDTDQKPFEDYDLIKKKIDDIHGNEGASDNVIIFANPCTMQIMLMHFGDVRLNSHKKEENAVLIEALLHIRDYSAKKNQRDEMNRCINHINYQTMKYNISKLSLVDKIVGSTNFLKFADWFENEDDAWINHINNLIENG